MTAQRAPSHELSRAVGVLIENLSNEPSRGGRESKLLPHLGSAFEIAPSNAISEYYVDRGGFRVVRVLRDTARIDWDPLQLHYSSPRFAAHARNSACQVVFLLIS